MQSLINISRTCTNSVLHRSRAAPKLLGPPSSITAIRAKSGSTKNEDEDMKAFYYPNTKVGIKERSVKADSPPAEPLQTPYPPFPEGKNPKTGEHGGPTGPEPTRFGDWERKGRVTDF